MCTIAVVGAVPRRTIEEIAELADVSRSTVSRVLNNHRSVRPDVRARVQQIIQEQRYAPRAAARSLASRRSNALGLLIPRSAMAIFSDPFFPYVIQGITETSTERGYFVMLSMVMHERERDFYERVLRGHHVDGLIMLSSDIDDPILPQLIRDETPLVLIGRHPYLSEVSTVDVDNREGAAQAVRHLIELGHRNIATITGPHNMAVAMDRRDGYKQALAEAGIPIRPELIVESDFTQAGGYEATGALLKPLPRTTTAVFVASDPMAVGALRAIQEHGLRIPEQLAIASFDDLPLATLVNPPLTTVHQPVQQLGSAAVDLLLNRLDASSEAPPDHVLLETHLVVRQSTIGASALQAR
ncbi:MAG: LacI family DNA-binding transcriptional regulator [Chloroflexi bacterium]|nr:LacI family DNA-binding transcriptional regulator [Chloroflexota bacterium]